MSPLTQGDRRLAARAGRGDDAAFARLAARHRERLVRAARRRLGDRREDAEDVVQEALINALRALRGGKRPENPGAWLMTIVANCCHDHHRAATRRAVVPLLEDADGGAVAEDLDPHHRAEERAQVAGAVAAVRALPESQRAALVGFELGGRTYEQLAAEHGWSVPATKSLLWRARTTLAAERERWAAALGTPLIGLAQSLRTGLAAVGDKPAALLGAHQVGDVATYAAVAVLAAGAAGPVATGGDGAGDAGDDRERSADVVRAAHAVRDLPAAAEARSPGEAAAAARAGGADATSRPAAAGDGRTDRAPAGAPRTSEEVLRACSLGQPLDGADPRALTVARQDVPSDVEQYTDCAADISRALAAG